MTQRTKSVMKIKHIALSATLLVFTLTGPSWRATTAAVDTTPAGEWFFVVIETHVHAKNAEVSSEHPEERRWYISNVATLPDNIPDYSAPKKVVLVPAGLSPAVVNCSAIKVAASCAPALPVARPSSFSEAR